MAKTRKPICSKMAWSTAERIVVRGKDLPSEVLGHFNLGDMAFLELTGCAPNAQESTLFNAMVVSLVEHGLTPSAIAARMTYFGAPEAMQAAVGHLLEEARAPISAELWHRSDDEASEHLKPK